MGALDDIAALLPQYIDEARVLADRLVQRCVDENHHFLFLDTDAVEGSFTVALGQAKGRA